MKLTNIVDDFVTQVALFAGNVLWTAFTFWRSPENLFGVLAGSTSAESYVSPITFLALSLLAFGLTLIALHNAAPSEFGEPSDSMSSGSFSMSFGSLWKAITEGDWKKLGLLSCPFFAVIAMHAGSVDVAAKVLGHSLDFRVALGATCYLLGSFYFVCALSTLLVMPWLRLVLKGAKWIRAAAAIPFWIVALRGFYSYLILLSHFLNSSALKSLGVFALGTAVFLVCGLLFTLWMSPLLFRDHDQEDQHHPEPEQRV